MRKFAIPFAAFGLCFAMAAPALAENIEVHMLNKGAEGAMVLSLPISKPIPVTRLPSFQSTRDTMSSRLRA